MAEVGIREVAALAGVSLSTVSNALNRPELVSATAAVRVAEAIATLGYVPNVAARQLRAGRSNAIGMAVMNISNPFFAEIVLGAEEEAELVGYSVIVGNSFDSIERERRYLDLFERQRLDGVLIAPVAESLDMLDRFRSRGVPVVLVDRVDPAGSFASVSLNDVLGGTIATMHLIEGGSEHILFLGGPFRVPQMRERRDGCEAAARSAGARFSLIETDTLSAVLGRELGDRIAALPPAERPDGIFAANDVLALGVMQSLLSHGISIPGEISIVGYDDIDFAAGAMIPLTSIRQPSHEMGSTAATLLLAQLVDTVDAPPITRFEPTLMPRDSSAAGRRMQKEQA